MQIDSRIYVAGHRGLVGSAIMRRLAAGRHANLITRTHSELDLTSQVAVQQFFRNEKPEYVILAAAKVGGILANDTYPAEFIYENLMIQANVIHAAYLAGVKRLLFLGSSCIYPKFAPQPLKEEYLLTGALEPTNRPYALAKIAGIEQCWSYNRQYGAKYLAVMPTNLYGPGDNYDLNSSHVIPALIRKFHEAKVRGDKQVVVWGTGAPRREFLYSVDMADACIRLLTLADDKFEVLLGSDESRTGRFEPPLINIGSGEDITIRELAELMASVLCFKGQIAWDRTRPDGTPQKRLDVTRMKALGIEPKVELKHGLELAYKDYLETESTVR